MNNFLITTKNIFIFLKYSPRFSLIKFNFFNVEPLSIEIPELSCCLSNNNNNNVGSNHSSNGFNELMQDGIVLFGGAPKKRRNVERRLARRFGVENYPDCTKIIRSREDLVICERCGDHHEYYTLCPSCYRKVKEETEKIREAIKKQIDPLMPKEKEVFIRFQDDQEPNKEEEQKFHVIDIEHPRPQWFSKNLMSKSTGYSTYNPKDVVIDPKDLINQNNQK